MSTAPLPPRTLADRRRVAGRAVPHRVPAEKAAPSSAVASPAPSPVAPPAHRMRPPWLEMPANGRIWRADTVAPLTVDKLGTNFYALDAAAAADEFIVIKSLRLYFKGNWPLPGDGQLLFRVYVNDAGLPGYGQSVLPFGSAESFEHFEDSSLLLRPNEHCSLVLYSANNNDLAGGTIFAGLRGWRYPK